VSHCVVFLIYSSHHGGSSINRYALILHALSSSVHSSRLLVVFPCVSNDAKLLSSEICAECDGRDAEAGERALEAVEAGERACVSPLLTV
jgi:hypothetical protein